MPAQAYIEYKEKGFWIPEAFIEILSEYICEAFEKNGLNSFSENLQKIYDDCDSNRRGGMLNMVDITLDDINNENDKDALIVVFEQTKALILSNGEELTIDALDQIESRKVDDEFKRSWRLPIKTQSLAATLDIMQQLLKETWAYSDYGVYYIGFSNNNQEQI